MTVMIFLIFSIIFFRIDKYITKDTGKDNVFMVDSSKAAQKELIRIAEMVSERGTEIQMPEANQRPFPESVRINFYFFLFYISIIFIYLFFLAF